MKPINEKYKPLISSPLARKMKLTNTKTGEVRFIDGARAVARFLNCSLGNVRNVLNVNYSRTLIYGWTIEDIDDKPKRQTYTSYKQLIDKNEIKFEKVGEGQCTILPMFSKYLIYDTGLIVNRTTRKPITTKPEDGYLIARIYRDDGKLCHFKIHRLIAQAFLDYIEDKYIVNHKDGNRSNNHYTNLEWSTFSENTRHSINNGQNGKVKPVKAINKLTDEVRYFVSARNCSMMLNLTQDRVLNALASDNFKNKTDWYFHEISMEEFLKLKEDNKNNVSLV